MKPNFSSYELIKFAVTIEEEGVKFYEKHAAKAEGNNKILLQKLADDEKQHAAVFGTMLDGLEVTNDFEYLNDFDVEAMFKAYANNEVFNKRREADLDKIDDVLELAAETEDITIKYYEELLPHATEPLKGILERLVEEEQGHAQELRNLMSL